MTVLSAMAEAWLADRPHGGVDAAHGLLLDVRDAVHVVTGRGRDRLGREDHDAVAALLGHDDADDLLTAVSSAGRHIAYAARRHAAPRRPVAARPHPAGRPAPPADDPARPRPVRQRRRGRARLDPARPRPTRGCRCAPASSRPAPACRIAPTTLDNLAEHAPTAARRPGPRPLRDLFGDLLASGPGLVTVWEGLDQAGIVDTLAARSGPPCARARSAAPCTATPSTATSSRPWCCAGRSRAPGRAGPTCCSLAALLHDIGKVRGRPRPLGDRRRARRARSPPGWGFAPRDVEVLVTLVREHLTLIELATRRDHQDPAHGRRGRRRRSAATGEVFEMLLALTEADASAAGPAAWTDWRATLLDQLAVAVRARLDGPSHARRRRRRRPRRGRPRRAARRGGPRRGRAPESPTCGHRHRRLAPHRHHRPRPGRPVRRHGRPARRARATPCAPPSCAPSTASRSTSGTSSRRAARRPTRRASSAAWPGSAAGDRAPARRPSTGAGPTWRARPARRRSAPPGRRGPWSSPARAATPRCSRCAPRTGPACSTSSASALAGRRHLGALGPHRHVCRADARHVLPHRLRRPAAAAGPGRAGGQPDHRHLRRHLTRPNFPARCRNASPSHRNRSGAKVKLPARSPPGAAGAVDREPRSGAACPAPLALPGVQQPLRPPDRDLQEPPHQGPALGVRRQRDDPRHPPGAARRRRRAARRQGVHPRRARAGARRRGQRGAEPGAAGRQDRQRGARRASSAARRARIRFAKQPPTVIMLAGLQGSGKTTLAGKLGPLAQGPGPHPAPRRRRPPAPQRRHPARGRRRAGRRAGLRARARQRRRPRRRHRVRRGHPQPSATRSPSRAPASSRPAASSTTSSSSTPPAASPSTPT